MRNQITRLLDDNGNWVSSYAEIKCLISSHFAILFATDSPKDFSSIIDCIPPRVSDSMNANLLLPVTLQEVKDGCVQFRWNKSCRT